MQVLSHTGHVAGVTTAPRAQTQGGSAGRRRPGREWARPKEDTTDDTGLVPGLNVRGQRHGPNRKARGCPSRPLPETAVPVPTHVTKVRCDGPRAHGPSQTF